MTPTKTTKIGIQRIIMNPQYLFIPLELTDAPLAGVLPAGGETERPISIPRPLSGVPARR